jgi:hypothetical protein
MVEFAIVSSSYSCSRLESPIEGRFLCVFRTLVISSREQTKVLKPLGGELTFERMLDESVFYVAQTLVTDRTEQHDGA